MTQKNEIPLLIAALSLATGIVGVGGWWLFNQFSGSGSNPLSGLSSGSWSGNASNSTANPIANIDSAATFADVTDVPAGLFSYGGSTTWAPIRGNIDPLITQAHPAFRLRYTSPPTGAPGSATGVQMLLDNQLAFAQSSRSLQPDEIAAAQQKGFSLVEIPVALEAVAIAVNPDLTVDGITIDQLKDIYTGQLTNWSQVGGPNLPIIPYSRRVEEGGTVEFFVDTVLGGIALGANVQYLSTTTEALRALDSTPGGIYYASAPEVIDQCSAKPIAIGIKPSQLVPLHQLPLVPQSQCPNSRNQINPAVILDSSYPITRRLLVIVKEDGQTDQSAGQAYANFILSQQGQQLLEQSGFVRIR
ncbi:MAG: PstS family phosphate ABC transporter substrate-binding protein [Leptolyngbyaceae bacterium]|nr:PstS family phosphate ABC transporter substrate-binding protein [Leptolyngbyaceae bacterium]